MTGGSTRIVVDRPADGILRVTFHEPARRNALDRAAWRVLETVLDGVAADADVTGADVTGADVTDADDDGADDRGADEDGAPAAVRCLLLRGAGGTFCSGGDIGEYELLADAPEEAAEYLDLYIRVFGKLRRLPIPTLAAVDGAAVGAGLALAAGCDFRIATHRAHFSVTAVKRGLIYPVEEIARLVSLIGMGITQELILRGAPLDAGAAHQRGLVAELVGEEVLDARALAIATGAAATAGPIYAATKHLFARIERGDPRESAETRTLALVAFGADGFRDGTRAFFEDKERE
jgi:enoyl-CoA hydratase